MMKYNLLLAPLICCVFSTALALLRFPEGTLVLQGKILVHEKDVFLVVNSRSDAETRIKLRGALPKGIYKQGGSNASVKIKILKAFRSNQGEAEFVELKEYLDPFTIPLIYHEESQLLTE